MKSLQTLWITTALTVLAGGATLIAIRFVRHSRAGVASYNNQQVIVAAMASLLVAALSLALGSIFAIGGSQKVLSARQGPVSTATVTATFPGNKGSTHSPPPSPMAVAVIDSPRSGAVLANPSDVRISGRILFDTVAFAHRTIWVIERVDNEYKLFPRRSSLSGRSWFARICLTGRRGTVHLLSSLSANSSATLTLDSFAVRGHPVIMNVLPEGANIVSTVVVKSGKSTICTGSR